MTPTLWITTIFSLCLLLTAIVAITTFFCLRTARWYANLENQDFRDVIEKYREMLRDSTTAASTEKKILDLIEATNLNTKSLALVESALNQLVLRQVGFQDKTRQTQVGEETTTRVGNLTVVGRPTPTTLTPDGREGFVDETGKVNPIEPKSARELAATEPT